MERRTARTENILSATLISKCYTWPMPTARPRHMITETEALSRALEKAAAIWPEDRDKRAELLRHIIDKGSDVVLSMADKKAEKRITALAAISQEFSGMWPDNWHATMVEEWPE